MQVGIDAEKAIAGFAQEELARRGLLDFASLVYPGFETPRHIRHLAGLLERVERGELKRLCVSLSVRHGKSVLCSQVFPAWFVGRDPRRLILLTSHSEALATSFSRTAKNLFADERWPFPDVELAADSASVQRWNTTRGGGLYAVGVGGAITGRGGNLMIVDDALHDGLSQTERESAWKWFREVATPRLDPGGSIIVVAARFASDDIPGRLMDGEDAHEWEFVNLPAIAGDADPLGRAPGEALWPERFSLKELESRRLAMGSAAFEAQFQQNPLPVGGLLFRREWLEHRYDDLPASMPVVIQAIDCAGKSGLSNDRTAIATIVSDCHDFFVRDIWVGRVNYPELKRLAVEQFDKHRPRALFIEQASNGIALIDDLRASTMLPIVAMTATDSKIARVEAVTGLFEAGRVKFPRRAEWLEDALSELLRFPGSRLDDIVDAITWGITAARDTANRIVWDARHRENIERLGDWMAR